MTPPAQGHPDPTPPDPTLDDPMLRVLRERHPEVDVVVLPRSRPTPLPPVVAADELDGLAAGAERLVDDLLARLPLGDHTASRDGRWHTDEWGQRWYEAVVSFSALRPPSSSITFCTLPLPQVRSPMTMARPWSCRQAETISLALAL